MKTCCSEVEGTSVNQERFWEAMSKHLQMYAITKYDTCGFHFYWEWEISGG